MSFGSPRGTQTKSFLKYKPILNKIKIKSPSYKHILENKARIASEFKFNILLRQNT